MKKIIILIILILFVTNFTLNSQDREPVQQSFNYFGSSRLLDASDPLFQFNRFHRGWHWAYGKKMSEALSFTSAHTEAIVHNAGVPASFFKDSTDLIVNLQNITANGTSAAPLNAMMMIFEPTLKIETEGEFKTRLGDSTNPIFGFKYINPSISIKPNDRELRLNKIGAYGSPENPTIVLDEPWSKNELKYIPEFKGKDTTKVKYEGTQWYFTINLRRNDLLNAIDDSTVLSIRLPYSAFKRDTTEQGKDTILWTNGYIKFDSIPNDNYYSYYKEYDTTRGVYRELQVGNNTTEILIKRSHILQSMDSSITICAHFTCNYINNQNTNFDLNYFHNNPKRYFYHIDSIGIEVKYHGTLNIAIDYMKFETKNAQMLTRGAFDSLMIASVQGALDIFSDTSFTNRGISPKRFYTRDEGGLAFWGATRYFNKLIGNLGTYEGSASMPLFYNHYVNPSERWFCPWSFSTLNAVPFIYRVSDTSTAAGQAVFDYIPDTSYSMLANGRGNIIDLKSAGHDGANEMIITRRMLPLLNEDNGDITISALIDFRKYPPNPTREYFNYPLRKSISSSEKNRVRQLKLKVTYLGNCPVAIDWVRFETPNTRSLHLGEHDVLIHQGIQHALDTIMKSGSVFAVDGNKPFRFIFNVEGGVRNWPVERYMKKFMGDIITGENAAALVPQYDHYIGAADRWISYMKAPAVLASPLTVINWHKTRSLDTAINDSINLNLWKTLGLTQGYVSHPNVVNTLYPNGVPLNILNSEYETFLYSGDPHSSMRDASMEDYKYKYNVNWEGNSVSTMVYWETFLRQVLVDPMESGFIFSESPWFAQSFYQNMFKFDNVYIDGQSAKPSLLYNSTHSNVVVNAELYNLFTWNPVILGAKGLIYDGDADYPDQTKLVPNKYTLQNRSPGYDTFLRHEGTAEEMRNTFSLII